MLGLKSEDDDEIERLKDIKRSVKEAQSAALIACMLIVAATDIFVIAQAVRKRTFSGLPLKVKFSLIFYILVAPLSLYTEISLLIDPQVFQTAINSTFYQISVSVTAIGWFVVHWMFSWYYLQAACLMKMTFKAHSDAELAKVRRSKKYLVVLEYFVLWLLMLFMAFLTMMATGSNPRKNKIWDTAWFVEYAFMLVVIMVTTLFSFWHIHRNTKVIEHLGIRTNSTVMKLYILFFTGLILITVIMRAMYLKEFSSYSASRKIKF